MKIEYRDAVLWLFAGLGCMSFAIAVLRFGVRIAEKWFYH